jgi:hypothetical protein
MAPKPARSERKADNTNHADRGTSGIEADALTRYDEITGQPLLSEEELKALLEDPLERDSENPKGA